MLLENYLKKYFRTDEEIEIIKGGCTSKGKVSAFIAQEKNCDPIIRREINPQKALIVGNKIYIEDKMTRNELQAELRALGFKRLCKDGKTLVAYEAIKYYLYSNKTPIRSVKKVYLDDNGQLRASIWGYDDEIGYNINEDKEFLNL